VKLKRYGALMLLAAVVATPASLTAKTSYSAATDKKTQSAEATWDPRAGLGLQNDVPEVEINDTCPGQAIACGDVLTQATLTQGDADYINFNAFEGDVLILGTDSAGGLDPDTRITLRDGNCGSVVATDDDSGPGLFSRITFLVPATGNYVLGIEGIHAGVAGDYVAYVSCAPRDPTDVCETAPELPCGSFSIQGSTIGALNDYDLTDANNNDCTGFATAGSDVVYMISLSEFTLAVTYTSDVDGSLYLVTDCNNPKTSCVAGSDITVEGEPETISYEAMGGGPYYLILDNYLGAAGPAGDFTLNGYLDCPPPAWVNVAGFTNSGAGLGAAWGDYDKDGDDDVYLSKYGEANQLMKNTGSLSAVTDPLLNDPGNGRGALWADYDNDGDLDLYVSNALSENKLFNNDGAGNFAEVTGSPVNDTGDSRGAAWADYDNDGDLDLYLVNAYAANKLFENDGGGGFVDATSPPLDDMDNGTSVIWGDYDNDGDPDLYLVNFGQPNKLFENDGAGGFTDVTSAPLDDAGSGRGAAWGDYDNDGDLDIYLSNALTANKLFRNDGESGFTDVTTGVLGDPGDGRGVEWADYDNDGDLDIYLANALSNNRLFDNDGLGGFTDITSALLADNNSGQGVASADYDGDGDLDIYLVNAFNFDRLFRNDLSTGNHWLHIDLVGTQSNRSAIGARVRVVAGGVSQIREVSAGSGYLSQGSLTLEFGLGSATLADTVEICWPSGLKQDSVSVAADQRLTFTEAYKTSDAQEQPLPRHFRLLSNVPDPFNPSTQIRYLLPAPSRVSVTIYDARGRAVRRLFAGPQGMGLQSVTWNGTDDAGAPLSSGTYVARIESAYGSGTEKLTLLK
jgi:hypothetical protein